MDKATRMTAVVLAAALVVAGPVAGDSFRLTYAFSFGSVLEADVTGDLQEDGETVIVRAVENARLDGVPGPPLPFVTSLADLVDGTALNDPVLTLSGVGNDFSACSDETCVGEFITFDGVKRFLGAPGVFTSPAFGSTYSGGTNAGERYEPESYGLAPR